MEDSKETKLLRDQDALINGEWTIPLSVPDAASASSLTASRWIDSAKC